MRIISQDKNIDVAYEMVLVIVSPNNDILVAFPGEELPIVVGQYATRERAIEVMNEIRRHYLFTVDSTISWPEYFEYFYMPKDDEVNTET